MMFLVQPTSATLTPMGDVNAEEVHAAIEILNKNWYRESVRSAGVPEALTGAALALIGARAAERSTSILRHVGTGAALIGVAAMGHGMWVGFRSSRGYYKMPEKDWRALNQLFDLSPNQQFQTAMMNPEFAAFLIDLAAFVKGRVAAIDPGSPAGSAWPREGSSRAQ